MQPGPVQQIIFFIFHLNCWFNRAYTNGLTAELNRTIVSTIDIMAGLMVKDGRFLKTYSTDSAPQQTPNMVLTVTTIKVTRFRFLITACGRGMQSLINNWTNFSRTLKLNPRTYKQTHTPSVVQGGWGVVGTPLLGFRSNKTNQMYFAISR